MIPFEDGPQTGDRTNRRFHKQDLRTDVSPKSYAEVLHSISERAGIDTEDFCRATGAVDSPIGIGKDFLYVTGNNGVEIVG